MVTIQSGGRGRTLGWHWRDKWLDGSAGNLAEINLSAEHLSASDVAEVLLHELAHAENAATGVKDCSGAVHNKRFKKMAERVGLLVKGRTRDLGFGVTERGPMASDFVRKIKFKHKLFRLDRTPPRRPGSRLRLWECACPEPVKARVASDDFQATCNRCGSDSHLQPPR